MKEKSVLVKVMMLEVLSGVVEMKYNKMSARIKEVYFPTHLMKWVCMSYKGHEKNAINTSTINVHVYIEILDNLLIPLTEN